MLHSGMYGLIVARGGTAVGSQTRPRRWNSKSALRAFQVHRTAADGNCLFNAIVQSRSLNSGDGRPLGDAEEKSQARALRDKVVAQLLVRRDFVEPFLPVPFDEYVEVMSRQGTWGGEPELSMASIVLEAVISVHTASDMSLVAEYDVAEVKGSQSSVRIPVLYHQDLHYEALKDVALA